MNAISVGYRFSREELSTMLQALRIDGLPGAPLGPVDKDTADRVLAGLSRDGMTMLADGTLYIDRLIGCLLRSAAEAVGAVALTDGSRTDVLWRAPKLLILGDFPGQGECSLTPLADEASATAALADAVCRLQRPLWGMNVFIPERRFTAEADDPASGEEIAAGVMALMAGEDPEPPGGGIFA